MPRAGTLRPRHTATIEVLTVPFKVMVATSRVAASVTRRPATKRVSRPSLDASSVAWVPPRGWLPAVMPGTGFATVGGCIGMDVHGKNHHGAGSFGQHVAAFDLVTPDGPRRITPEDAPDLFRATMGGLGQTGINSPELLNNEGFFKKPQ